VSGVELSQRLRGRRAATSAQSGASVGWAQLPAQAEGTSGGKKRRRSSGPEAAEGEKEEEEEEEEGEDGGPGAAGALGTRLLTTTGRLTQASLALPSASLSLVRLKDANIADPARSTVRALAWHPSPGAGVLCVGSGDSRLRFFRVDGASNARLASVHLKDLPVTSAGWTGDGAEVVATGRRPFFYSYDVGAGTAQRIARLQGRSEGSLESAVVSPSPTASETAVIAFLGNDGTTILASARTKQWVANLACPSGSVRAAAFSRGPTGGGGGAGALDFPTLLTTGSAGEVAEWCLRTMRCQARYRDEGSTGGTALAAHPSGTRFAVGSSLGVVNEYALGGGSGAWGGGGDGGGGSALGHLFQRSAPLAPKPLHAYLNLTTAIDHLSYGGGGEVLSLSSHRSKEYLRLAHVGSGRVFSNWPTARTPLGYVTGGAVQSPGGGYLALGNDKGRVLLYRLSHYKDV
jgi:U3 small nucleolar RNA-associated protein 18